jgi:hypothetical protein
MKTFSLPLSEVVLLSTGFIALIGIQIFMAVPVFNDEFDYIGNVALLHQYGFGKKYLISLVGSAGPLYSMVHFMFEPITKLHGPYVRLINSSFLIAVILIIYRILRLLRHPTPLFTFYAMALPTTYVIAGLALTEMPAMFFFTFSIYLVIKSRYDAGKYLLLKTMTAGLCMSLAIIGRQPYLLTIAAFPLLFISNRNIKKGLLLFSVFLLFSSAVPLYVFNAWNGLVPTIESQLYIDIANAGISYRPDFFLLCMFYLAVSMILAAPGFYSFQYTTKAVAIWIFFFGIIATGNFIFRWIELFPVRGILNYIPLDHPAESLFANFTGTFVILLSIYFMVCIYRHLITGQYKPESWFFAAALTLIALACIKITWGYSSRYAGQAMPLLLLFGSFFYRRSKYNIVRIAVGVITGIIALVTYFPKK